MMVIVDGAVSVYVVARISVSVSVIVVVPHASDLDVMVYARCYLVYR